MKIGIDIDNVISNFNDEILKEYIKHDKELRNTGIINENDKKLISRHEITASLEDFIKISSFLLKDYGEFYMVHRPDRLVDIFTVMRKNKIEPKKVKFVYPNQNKKTNLVLIKGVKNGKQFLEFENNLYVYNENGKYTDEILKIYNKI